MMMADMPSESNIPLMLNDSNVHILPHPSLMLLGRHPNQNSQPKDLQLPQLENLFSTNQGVNAPLNLISTNYNATDSLIQDLNHAQYNSPSFAAGGGGHNGVAHPLPNSGNGSNYNSKNNNSANNQSVTSENAEEGQVLYRGGKKGIQESKNLSVIHHQSQSRPRSWFLKLPGEVLAMLGDFLNEKLPLFIFTNRISFNVCLHY